MGCPVEFLRYMKHNRELNFEEKPDYQMLMDMMRGLAEKEGLELDYRNYDWAIKIQKVQRPLIKAASPPVLAEGGIPPREQDPAELEPSPEEGKQPPPPIYEGF